MLPLKVALTSFPTVAQAVSTVVAMLSAGLTPTSLELLDGTSIHGLNLAKLLPAPLPEEPTILMRFSNPDENANYANLEVVRRLVEQNGGRELQVARNEEENEQLWKARKARDHGALCAVCQNKLTERLPRYLQSQYWSQQLLVGEGCRTLVNRCTAVRDTAPELTISLPPDHRRLRARLASGRIRLAVRRACRRLGPGRSDCRTRRGR